MTSVIMHFNFDKPFILYMNVSGKSIRAVLHQKSDNEKEWIIAYASRTFNEHEKKYPIIEQECLVIIWGIKKFK